jgi:hypothetical protein
MQILNLTKPVVALTSLAKIVAAVSFFTLLSFDILAQTYTVTINGPTIAAPGESKNYTITWKNSSGQTISPPAGNSFWGCANATITSSTATTATIYFPYAGSRNVAFEHDLAGDTHAVTVSGGSPPATPNTTFTSTQNCGSTLVVRNSNPPAGTEWYWQTSSSGFVTTLGSGTSITRTSGGPLYLRARNSTSLAWSTLLQSVGTIAVNSQPAAPATATHGDVISNTGGTVPLSVSAVSGATGYQWFTVSTGGTAIAGATTTAYSPTVTQTQTFYVQTLTGSCVSTTRTPVTARVHPAPSIVATNSGNVNMGVNVTLSLNYVYDTYQWRKDGVNIAGATSSTYATNLPGLYSVTVAKGSAFQTSSAISLTTGADGQNKNFIVSNTMTVPVTNLASLPIVTPDHTIQTIQYFDGLGRPLQQVSTQATSSHQDMVQPFSYDAYGRETIKYLPYVSGTNGQFKSDFLPKENVSYATTANAQYQFYQATSKVSVDAKPYVETRVEASPLKRPIEQGSPGSAWQPDNTDTYTTPVDKSIKFAYEFNQTRFRTTGSGEYGKRKHAGVLRCQSAAKEQA